MKKAISVTLLILLVLLFTGCTSNSNDVLPDNGDKIIATVEKEQTDNHKDTQDELLKRINSLQNKIESLQKELLKVTSERDSLQADVESAVKDITVQEGDVTIECINKINMPKNTDNWVFSDRVEFELQITNNTDKAIRGVQGELGIKDIFGVSIMNVGCDITGSTIEPYGVFIQKGLGFDVNEYRDTQLKVYLTAYEDLIFEYTVTQIIFTDGTSKTL